MLLKCSSLLWCLFPHLIEKPFQVQELSAIDSRNLRLHPCLLIVKRGDGAISRDTAVFISNCASCHVGALDCHWKFTWGKEGKAGRKRDNVIGDCSMVE